MSYQNRADHLAAMMEERLGIRGPGLRAKLRRAGRLLPTHVRRDAMVLVDALQYAGNPKLARRLDAAAIDRACRNVEEYLSVIDPQERRVKRLLAVLSSAAVAVLATAAMTVTVLVWRGYV